MPEEIREETFPLELAETHPGEPTRRWPTGATIAILPDTQYYVACGSAHVATQARWVTQSRKKRNIFTTLTLGDLTDHNTHKEWAFVRAGLQPIEAAMPLVPATGNHDYGTLGRADRRETLFDQYFPPGNDLGALAATKLSSSVENAYYRFEIIRTSEGLRTTALGIRDASPRAVVLGVLVLGWSPVQTDVDWAKTIVEKYSSDRRVFLTHAYLYYDDTRYDAAARKETQRWNPLDYGTARGEYGALGNHDGEMLWQHLLRADPGLVLTLNGHVLGDGTGLLTSQGDAKNQVHQVLINYQMLAEGGLGYLRLLELDPSGTRLFMSTYSPSLDRHSRARDQTFELPIDPPLFTARPSGSQ